MDAIQLMANGSTGLLTRDVHEGHGLAWSAGEKEDKSRCGKENEGCRTGGNI